MMPPNLDPRSFLEAHADDARMAERERAARFAQALLLGLTSPMAPPWTVISLTVAEVNALVDRLRSGDYS